MGSGVSSSTQKSEQNLYNAQAAQANTYSQLARQNLAKMDALTQPQINADTSLIKGAQSGNYSQLLQAFAPQQSIINEQMTAARSNIQHTTPEGPGQAAALANLPVAAAGATASGLNSAYQGALKDLTQIGSGYAGVGLQEAGAGISAGSAASTNINNQANQQAQGKADTMGFLGSLAGAGGSALSGAFKF